MRCTSSLSCRGRSATRPAENLHSHTVRRATEARLTTYPALTGGIGIVFGSPDFPEDVKSVFFDVAIPLRSRFKYEVGNKCTLFLDFRRPEVVNFAMLPSQPTPNETNFAVNGSDATWVNGVFHEFTEYTRSHRSRMSWLHRHTVYDVLLWILGSRSRSGAMRAPRR